MTAYDASFWRYCEKDILSRCFEAGMRSYVDTHGVEEGNDTEARLQACNDADDDLFRSDAPLWQSEQWNERRSIG